MYYYYEDEDYLYKRYCVHLYDGKEFHEKTLGFYDKKKDLLYVLTPSLLKLFDTSCMDKISYTTVRWYGADSKTEIIKTIPQLQKLGIFILKYHPKGLNYAILDYLNHLFKDVPVKYVQYSQDEITDTTGRSWVEIVEKGYRGNRLDLMVGEYFCYVRLAGEVLKLGRKADKGWHGAKNFYTELTADLVGNNTDIDEIVKGFIMYAK
jgi:hypothetical protein